MQKDQRQFRGGAGGVLATDEQSSQAPPELRGYRPELDVVRFLAFFFVFLHHLLRSPQVVADWGGFLGFLGPESWRVRLALAEACGCGLPLFFALSAYLITDILLREREKTGAVSIRRFYIRRILRIWPLYFTGIAVGVGIALLLHRRGDVVGFLWYLLFAGNIYCGLFGWPLNPMTALWSISIEEQFYLVWPWLMRFARRRMLPWCALALIAVANVRIFWMGQHHIATEVTVWTDSLVELEMFAAGILLALFRETLAKWSKLPLKGIVLLGPVLWFAASFWFGAKEPENVGLPASGMGLMAGYGLIALGCVCILQGFCWMRSDAMPRWAVKLGKISYGLYVFHVLSIEFAEAVLHGLSGAAHLLATGALAMVITVSIAAISYEYLESPFLRLKQRFEILHTRPI